MTTDDLLKERGETHGSFEANAYVAQEIKDVIRLGDNYADLSFVEREALDMFASKIARIVNGKSNKDNLRDIIGYATLVLESYETEEQLQLELDKCEF